MYTFLMGILRMLEFKASSDIDNIFFKILLDNSKSK